MNKKVFVLGAGFTKAFVPGAPLMRDNYSAEVATIVKKLGAYDRVRTILEAAQQRETDGLINIERLFTRLEVGMPYDTEESGHHELGVLLTELMKGFVSRIDLAKEKVDRDSLGRFADYCLRTRATCITFNYDDVLDRAVWEAALRHSPDNPYKHWGPDGGYGFFCKPSTACIQSEGNRHLDVTRLLILKLHGSLNWRIRKGFSPPYSVDAIVHHEEWFQPQFGGKLSYENESTIKKLILNHIRHESFIVPPVLTKLSLVQQPILRLVWLHAYEALADADEVVFIGYSMPITDIAASFLFAEPLTAKSPKVTVVTLCKNEVQQQELKHRYISVLPKGIDARFIFEGALSWLSDAN